MLYLSKFINILLIYKHNIISIFDTVLLQKRRDLDSRMKGTNIFKFERLKKSNKKTKKKVENRHIPHLSGCHQKPATV